MSINNNTSPPAQPSASTVTALTGKSTSLSFLKEWTPFAVINVVIVIGVFIVATVFIEQNHIDLSTAWTTDNITSFFAKVALIISLLTPMLVKASTVYTSLKTQPLAANQVRLASVVNGELSDRIGNAAAAAVDAYATEYQVSGDHQKAITKAKLAATNTAHTFGPANINHAPLINLTQTDANATIAAGILEGHGNGASIHPVS